jgi:hypothetical protein
MKKLDTQEDFFITNQLKNYKRDYQAVVMLRTK